MNDVKQSVKDYYGKVLSHQNDLKTSACCSTDAVPLRHRKILGEIEPEILDRFYGCGSPIPPSLEGQTVLDLGSGTGRDAYLCSKLVGPDGRVIGVDMTDEQLDVASKYIDPMMTRFGFDRPNVEFRKGYIENLRTVGVEDESVDVVISNCVINLSPDKPAVMSEIFRTLRPGGELYFSDVFADRRVPDALRDDELLYGECLSGALYTEDFRRILQDNGCPDFRVVNSRRLTVDDPELSEKVGNIGFFSITVRAFKLGSLEDRCEDYGQIAVYDGSIPEAPNAFVLDDHHTFETGKPELVCGNTAAMLEETRYRRHFTITGDRSRHFGLFDCGPGQTIESDDAGAACC
jgi:ubiquinone/menaquinone biosynthesis C-methylase UbiE